MLDRFLVAPLVLGAALTFAAEACTPKQECPAPVIVVQREPAQDFPAPDETEAGSLIGPDGVARQRCLRACSNLAMLGCPEAKKLAGGDSCTTTCARLLSSGFSAIDPECMADAKTKVDVRKCNVRCEP